MSKSRWNPKTCSNNLQKGKKEKPEQQELNKQKINNKIAS